MRSEELNAIYILASGTCELVLNNYFKRVKIDLYLVGKLAPKYMNTKQIRELSCCLIDVTTYKQNAHMNVCNILYIYVSTHTIKTSIN